MASNFSDTLSRAKDTLEHVTGWWQKIVCSWPKDLQDRASTILLAGIFLSLRELIERIGQGGNYFRITPFVLVANGPAVRVVEKDVNGLSRRIFAWVDSAVGLPDPRIRIGTAKSSVNAGGVQLTAGVANEVGKVPPNTELWMTSDVGLTIYIVEEA